MKPYDSSTRPSLRRPQGGAVLVVVLLAMLGLLGMGLAGLYLTSGSLQMNSNINMRNQALYVAEAGIQTAKAILNRTRPGDPTWQPDLDGMLQGIHSPSGAAVATPSGYTDEIPGRLGTDPNDSGCLGKSSNGVPTRGAYLRDEDPLPTDPPGFGCQNDPDSSKPFKSVYIDCYYPPQYPNSSHSYNEAPSDPNMSAAPTQYMGRYTLFIRQDLAECRQGYTREDYNRIVVIRSEGIASDNRTKVVLEVTMSTNPNVQILSQGIATVCPAGAAGCDDNASVQQGITVGPPAPPGAGGSSGSGGTSGSSCSKDSDCPNKGDTCCNGACCTGTCCGTACVDLSTDSTHCGTCSTQCKDPTPACCGGNCTTTPGTTLSDTTCGPCRNIQCKSPTHCCASGTSSACVDETTDPNNCGGCASVCTSGDSGVQPVCCNGSCCSPKKPVCCNTACQPPAPIQNTSTYCGVCGLPCTGSQICCSDAAGGHVCKVPLTQNNTNNKCCGLCCDSCDTASGKCCAPDNPANYKDGSHYSCIAPPQCPALATIGQFGPWDSHNTSQPGSGSGMFQAWLKEHTAGCGQPLDLVDSNNQPELLNPDRLGPYKVLVLLDVNHSHQDFLNKISSKTEGSCESYRYRGKGMHTADSCYDNYWKNANPPLGMRAMQESEAAALGSWIQGGGGLITIVGNENDPYEVDFPNTVLAYAAQGTGVTPIQYSTFYRKNPNDPNDPNNQDDMMQFCGGATYITGVWDNTSTGLYGFKTTGMAAALTNGVYYDPIKKIATGLRASEGFQVTPAAYSASDTNPFAFARDRATDGDEQSYPLQYFGTKYATIGVAGTYGLGRVVVWGDEWITYDTVWGNMDGVSKTYAANVFWDNLVKWLGQCSSP